MVRGAALALLVALSWARASVLVPTYVLPPDSFARDQRSLAPAADSATADSQRTIKRLMGGHMKIKPEKEYGDPAKNSFAVDAKSEKGKFVGVFAPEQSSGNVGWNQGVWDDGMLMSSAGDGKDVKGAKGTKDNDEDAKTLSDQVAEGKYGLIQNEIFANTPKRPGIVSYAPNSETRAKDNLQSLGGLKKEEIWLAEDHLLVLKGGSFPERTKETEKRPWPTIDDYEAPRRQVKLPQKPVVPPPFPVRLSDDGPLVFLTPNGSVPAALFPPFATGEGQGPVHGAPLPPGAPYAPGGDQGNTTSGGAPFPFPPFPFLPGNASEGPFPFPPPMNGSFPEGFPPGAAFLPPPGNQTDLYDEEDPSIYYPPPYNFSYRADYESSVPAGPLVPGIVLAPPPDFFAPLEEKPATTESTTTHVPSTSPHARPKPGYKRPTVSPAHRKPYKPRPTTTTESTRDTEEPSTISTPPTVIDITTPKARPTPSKLVPIPPRNPIRIQTLPDDQIITKPEKPVYKTRTKVTSKPLSVSVIYDYPEPSYKGPTSSAKPYLIYSVPEKSHNSIADNLVTSTPVPLAYYSQHEEPTTKLRPVYNKKPTENSLASFYFYDEQPKSSPTPANYYDSRNYYNTAPVSQAPVHHNVHNQQNYGPQVDVAYGSFDPSDALFLWPHKQGPRTLTQEYFSIQKPRVPQVYVQQPKQRPDFYQQIADIQHTIDLFTTKKPKSLNRPLVYSHKPKAITSRPVYQFSFQSKPRQEVNFRAPKLDPEPFRPMVSYSKPFNLANDFNAITPSVTPAYNQQYLIENVQVTTETPTPTSYYPKTKPRIEEYDESPKEHRNIVKKNRNHINQNDKQNPVIHIANVHQRPNTTPSPINHGYYTKQDERYFDDITKNSFDVFGKKIEDNRDVHGLAVTPPLGTVRTPIDNNINLQYAYDIVETQTNPPNLITDTRVNERLPRPTINPYSETIGPQISREQLVQQKPPSLAGDTLVNEKLPRPSINPDSEFVPIPNPRYQSQQYKPVAEYGLEQLDLNAPTLEGDTDVNYKRPLPENPDAEWVGPGNAAGEGKAGSFVSYRLPGEGAHVYFLTPQAAGRSRERVRPHYAP